MTSVLFTFDYELFLGRRSGNARACILNPTARLLDLFRQYEFKAIFFVDTVYLMRLQTAAEKYPRAGEDLAAIREQIAEMVRDGHSIFPHIHAHWLDAVYLPDENEWSLENTRYYQFASVPPGQQRILFDGSMQILYSIADPVTEGYKADAYRAGGWSIQPFHHFRPFFQEYGIVHEWSIIPGKYHFSDAQTFDFRKAPMDREVYHFDEDPCIPDNKGPFTEWTISTLTMTAFEKWFNFKVSGLLHRLGRSEPRKGSTVSSVIREEGDVYKKGTIERLTASFEGLNPFTLQKYFSRIRTSNYFHFISHPKLLTAYELGMIEKFFYKLKKVGKIETDFRKVVL